MAIISECMGYKNAYHRIYGIEINEPQKYTIFRVMVFKEKPKNGDPDLRCLRSEHVIREKTIKNIVLKDAVAAVDSDQNRIESETSKAVAEINKNRKAAKQPALSANQIKCERINVRQRLISSALSDMAEKKLSEYMNALTGKMKGEKNCKKIGYEFMKTLPDFEGSKDDL